MSKLKVSEIFYSLQGEGRYVGVPSVFLRTFGCNFKCEGFGMMPGERSNEANLVDATKYKTFQELPLVHTGCDSYASWHPDFKEFSPVLTVDAVVQRCIELLPNKRWKTLQGSHAHLVITGGEPLLGWQRAYPDLLEHSLMLDLDHITFETNGTQDLSEDFADYIDAWHSKMREPYNEFVGRFRELQFSVSPKLSVSGEAWEDAIKPEVVLQYQQYGLTYLKFVVNNPMDFDEVDQAVAEYRSAGFMGPVYVMPVGGTVEGYTGNLHFVADEALKRGYYYSPRLHVDLWGNGWGK
jgi:organic radical activating enzyme